MLKKAANRTQVNCHQTRSKFDHQRHHFEIDSAHKKSPRTVDNLVFVKMLFCWTDCQEKELVLKCRRPWWNFKQSEGNLGKHYFTPLISNLSNIKISCILFHGGKKRLMDWRAYFFFKSIFLSVENLLAIFHFHSVI